MQKIQIQIIIATIFVVTFSLLGVNSNKSTLAETKQKIKYINVDSFISESIKAKKDFIKKNETLDSHEWKFVYIELNDNKVVKQEYISNY